MPAGLHSPFAVRKGCCASWYSLDFRFWRVGMGKASYLHAECAGPLRYTPVLSVTSAYLDRGSLCSPGWPWSPSDRMACPYRQVQFSPCENSTHAGAAARLSLQDFCLLSNNWEQTRPAVQSGLHLLPSPDCLSWPGSNTWWAVP